MRKQQEVIRKALALSAAAKIGLLELLLDQHEKEDGDTPWLRKMRPQLAMLKETYAANRMSEKGNTANDGRTAKR